MREFAYFELCMREWVEVRYVFWFYYPPKAPTASNTSNAPNTSNAAPNTPLSENLKTKVFCLELSVFRFIYYLCARI